MYCSHCGSPSNPAELKWVADARTVSRLGLSVTLTRVQAKIFDVLYRAKGPLSGQDVLDKAYADDPDGGPLNANMVGVHCVHINRKLVDLGIIAGSRNGYRSYGLTIVSPAASLQEAA